MTVTKKGVISGLVAGAALVAAGLLLQEPTRAEHPVTFKVREIHGKVDIESIQKALKGKGTITIDEKAGLVVVTVPHTTPVAGFTLIEALRSAGYEPLSATMKVGLDAKITLKSARLGLKDSTRALLEALGSIGVVDANSPKIVGNTITVPVTTNDIDLMVLLTTANKAGFAINGIDVAGSPAVTAVAKVENKARPGDEKVSYAKDIAPILAKNCYGCHGSDAKKRKADINFQEGYKTVIDHIDPGNPEDSHLFNALLGDRARQMPPNGALPGSDISLFRKWIRAGAKNN